MDSVNNQSTLVNVMLDSIKEIRNYALTKFG
jgi:hypothetical protein